MITIMVAGANNLTTLQRREAIITHVLVIPDLVSIRGHAVI